MKERDAGVKWFNTIFYPQKKTGRAIRYEDGVLPRLREKEIILFTPWGPRYSWESRGTIIQEGDKEVKVLNFLAELLNEMRNNMPDKNFRWIILGANLYGTRINNLPIKAVASYFDSLAQWLRLVLPMAEFQLWSQYDSVAEEYRQIARAGFDNLISSSILSRANQTARAMGKNSSAKDYLVERLAEAMLVENALKPVKISCVSRRKDNEVDWKLPCLYFLSEHFQAPWM